MILIIMHRITNRMNSYFYSMKYTDPLLLLIGQEGYKSDTIAQLVLGEKYLACLLKNGQLGVCATLGTDFPADFHIPESPDLELLHDRILLNAYFNAHLNYRRSYPEIRDIFDLIPFENYKRVVMIGYFASLVSKFEATGIHLNIFDFYENHPGVLPIDQQMDFIGQADALILTSTTIFNKSFTALMEATRPGCQVFLLGPSTILDPRIMAYPQVSRIFGMIFRENPGQVLEMIKAGCGTPTFGKFGDKVYL